MIRGSEINYQIHLRPVDIFGRVYWCALVIHNNALEAEWQGQPMISPESAAYLAKRYLQGKPDLKE